MDTHTAKTELLHNHFHHALDQLVNHHIEAGDLEALDDIRRMVDTVVDDRLQKYKPIRHLHQTSK